MGKKNKVKKKVPEYYQVGKAYALRDLLDKFPRDAKIYTSYDGKVVVYQGGKELAYIDLIGY